MSGSSSGGTYEYLGYALVDLKLVEPRLNSKMFPSRARMSTEWVPMYLKYGKQ